jgi:hypothetical protein
VQVVDLATLVGNNGAGNVGAPLRSQALDDSRLGHRLNVSLCNEEKVIYVLGPRAKSLH